VSADYGESRWTVYLSNAGDHKIQIIKIIRSVTGLGLKQAKDLADEAAFTNAKIGTYSLEHADQILRDLIEQGGNGFKEEMV
jgi:large subunit ribosomal protein L7/L12